MTARSLTGPSPGLDQSLGYDSVDRLTSWVPATTSQSYAYDAAGNRTQLTVGASSYPYTVSTTSNRVTQTAGPGGSKTFGYDAAGHTTALGLLTFAYDARGRMIQAVNGSLTATYQVNALGQRVMKTLSPGATTHYHYDAEGHLIAESSGAGAVQREYVWLADTPVALITYPNATVYFLQPDHLNTPRVLTNAANVIVWRWDSDPFGVSPPDQDPDGDSNPFVLNLRFPGQYFDAETGLHYNTHRDYDPQTGRYVQSDPIGLEGGINTYGYVSARPLERIDPLGLFLTSVDAACVQNPELCAEIGGQIVENAGALSGEQCTEEAAHSAAEAIRTLGTAAILTGIVKGAAAGAESAARAIVPKPGTRVRPPGVPENWRVRPSDSPGGVKYYDPKNPGNQIRVEQGNPNSPYPASREPYVRDLRNGQYRDAQGNVVPRDDPAGHIPLDQYLGYRP